MKKLMSFSLLVWVMSAPMTWGAEWLTDYGVALRQAQIEGRPLLVVLEKPATVQNVAYVEDDVDSELLEPYKLCKIDVTTSYGRRVAAAFKATEVPLTVIIDRTASVQLYRKTGAFQPEEWNAVLLQYREGRRPIRNVVSQIRSSRAFCST